MDDIAEATRLTYYALYYLAIAPNKIKEPCEWGESGQCSCDCDFMDCQDARLKWAYLKAENLLDAPKASLRE